MFAQSVGHVLGFVALFASLGVASAKQDAAISSGTFVTRLGVDTIAIERFSRSARRLDGEIVWRSPAFGAARYSIPLDSAGLPTGFTITNLTPNDVRRRPDSYRSARGQLAGDSMIVDVSFDSAPPLRNAFAGRSPVLTLPNSWAAREVLFAWMRRSTVDSARRDVSSVGDRGASHGAAALRVQANDSARIWNAPAVGPTVAVIDALGRLLSADARSTTSRYVVERLPKQVELTSLVRAFAKQQVAGAGLGALVGGRDTVRSRIGRVRIEIDYSAPRLRGRSVFTHGVLGDTLWRLGANAATALRIDGYLMIGGQRIPAGAYTLFMSIAPDNSRYDLVVNTQVGQWGTIHDPKRDLTRIPLQVASGPELEALTVTLDQHVQNRAHLVFAWDTLKLVVEVADVSQFDDASLARPRQSRLPARLPDETSFSSVNR